MVSPLRTSRDVHPETRGFLRLLLLLLLLLPPSAALATAPPKKLHPDRAVDATKAWIDAVVCELNLCPYAAAPFKADKIRYALAPPHDDYGADADADTQESALVDAFFHEALLLLDTDEDDVATTMLVAPHYSAGIEDFYSLYVRLTDLLEDPDEDVLQNQIQPAFFHPEWNFEGEPADSPTHFEKRAPCTVINLLRRSTLDRVVGEGLKRGVVVNKQIAEHNEAKLHEVGTERLKALFRHIVQQAGGSSSGGMELSERASRGQP